MPLRRPRAPRTPIATRRTLRRTWKKPCGSSASTGGEPIEASWESQINGALAQVKQAAESHDVSKGPIVDDGFNKVKIYIDQAQQAASIEY
jgi:hypothetical protein